MKKLIFAAVFCALSQLAAAGVLEDLEEAVIRGNSSDAIALMGQGMDVNAVDRFGNSLLMQSVVRDMPDFFDYLLKKRARLNVRNKNGEAAIALAAWHGRTAYVQKLIAAGAEVNFFGWSPLIYAAYQGHLDVLDLLLKNGAEINTLAPNGNTALFFAARFGHDAVVDALIKNGIDVSVANENGETAVDWALKAENTNIADVIRKAGGRSGKALVIELGK